MADAALLQRVLQNLIGNALKFTPEGGAVRVAARVSAESANPPVVIMSICDTGPGIPLEIQPNCFRNL